MRELLGKEDIWAAYERLAAEGFDRYVIREI